MLVLVLDSTQCLPQGAGALPAMLRCRMTGFPKQLGAGPQGGSIRWIQFAQSLLTVAHQPRASCIRLVHTAFFDKVIHLVTKQPDALIISLTPLIGLLFLFLICCNLFFRNETTWPHYIWTIHITIPVISTFKSFSIYFIHLSFIYCCYRPTPPACSCGGVRQPSFSREALPGVSCT